MGSTVKRMIKIVKGCEDDYVSIVASLNRKEHIDFITHEHVKKDIEKQQLYVVKSGDKNIAIFSITYDTVFRMYYLKRLVILNKVNTGKNISSQVLKFAKEVTIEDLAMTPWSSNEAMIAICKQQGFKFEKQIDNNYMLYVAKKERK